MSSNEDGPYTNFTYEVRIDDDAIGGFTRVSGIGAESGVMEYREGGLHNVTHTFPQDVSYSNVTLYRGMTADEEFLDWITQSMTEQRETVRSKVSISMQDVEEETKWTWVLIGAYPVRWEGPELAADGTAGRPGYRGFSIERLELAYERLDGRTG